MRTGPLVEFAVVGGLCALAYFVLIPAQISAQGGIGLRADVVPRVVVVAIALFAFLHMVARLTIAAPPSAPAATDETATGEAASVGAASGDALPGEAATGEAPSGEAAPPWRYVARLLAVIAVGYAAILWLGLVPGGAILVLVITLALGERRPLRLGLQALGGAAVSGLIPLLGL